ncbi:MAG: DNA-methyltransferase [Armatimonadota bacterium]
MSIQTTTSSVFRCLQTIGSGGAPSPLLPDGRSRLLQGECLAVMRALPDESFDVIYLDPPFFSSKDYHLHNGQRGSVHSFSDIWADGLQGYLDWLQERLVEARRLLQPEGALFLHLDWHAVHYAKMLLDHLFGYRNFQNEFIWYYGGGGASGKRFARKHDTILYYTKSETQWKFYADRVRTPHKWTRGQPRADGSSRNYEQGKLPDDVWQHHALMPWADESLGYPTQKPLALLHRLLLATTDEWDVVGDFVCGSGTSAVAAQQLGRRWVAADMSRMAVCLATERLAEMLSPGCIVYQARRPRARAKERFELILADDARIGLDAATLTTCQALLPPGTGGFSVETLDEE